MAGIVSLDAPTRQTGAGGFQPARFLGEAIVSAIGGGYLHLQAENHGGLERTFEFMPEAAPRRATRHAEGCEPGMTLTVGLPSPCKGRAE